MDLERYFKKFILILLPMLFVVESYGRLAAISPVKQRLHLTQYVDPYIGSAGHGHVFVEANVPFGMIQLGPTNISTGWDEYWIGFGGKDIEERVNNGFFSVQKPLFNVGIRDDIVQLYKQAITTAIEQHSGFQQVLAGIVSHLIGIAYARDKHSKFEDLRVVNQINQAKIRILENFTNDIDLKALSKEMSMSYSWFRRIYKQYTGLSPYHYIQELRIQKSKELLTDTMLTSQEVAYDVGFENPDYFCTAFKKHTGLSPIKYRELVQGGKSKSSCLSAV